MKGDAPLVVVDASIAVKWFVVEDEADVSLADELLASHAAGSVRLVAPALLVHEVFNVLLARRNCEVASLTEAMDAFFDADVALVSPDREQVAIAAGMVAQGLSTADAAYAALARVLGCRLVTADLRLAERAAVLLG